MRELAGVLDREEQRLGVSRSLVALVRAGAKFESGVLVE